MRFAALAIIAASLPALAGCEDKAEALLEPEKLLAKQHELWRKARESLASEKPDLMVLRSVEIYLCARTRSSVDMYYRGANKQEVLKQLDALRDAYRQKVMSKADPRSFDVRLKPGVTLAQFRASFMAVDKDYRRLEDLTRSKR